MSFNTVASQALGVCPTHYATVFEGSPLTVMTRVVGANAAAITQATLSAISYLVKQYGSRSDAENDTAGTSIITETILTLADVVFDSLQTDNDWSVDSVGYNVRVTVPASAFPTGGKWYRVEVWCDPLSGDDFLAILAFFNAKATARD